MFNYQLANDLYNNNTCICYFRDVHTYISNTRLYCNIMGNIYYIEYIGSDGIYINASITYASIRIKIGYLPLISCVVILEYIDLPDYICSV